MNNASKGRCVTVTPRGTRNFRFAIADFGLTAETQLSRKLKIAIWNFEASAASGTDQTPNGPILRLCRGSGGSLRRLPDHGD
jgi:hypothetical protein